MFILFFGLESFTEAIVEWGCEVGGGGGEGREGGRGGGYFCSPSCWVIPLDFPSWTWKGHKKKTLNIFSYKRIGPLLTELNTKL